MTSSASDADKAAVLQTVKDFLGALSLRRPPFADARKYVLPDAWCVLAHPDETFTGRISEVITRVERKVSAVLDSGAKEFEERIAEPGPEVWVHEDLGGVWAGYAVVVDGKEVRRGVNAFGLHRDPADGNRWKISGTADTQAEIGGELPPVVAGGPPAEEVISPVYGFLDAMTAKDWDKMSSYCLDGSGITNSRRSMGLLVSSSWPELMARLKGLTEDTPPGVIREPLYDIESRVCGDLAFLWTPFRIEASGAVRNLGVNIFTMVRKDGRWWISGCQDTSMPTA